VCWCAGTVEGKGGSDVREIVISCSLQCVGCTRMYQQKENVMGLTAPQMRVRNTL
jgi:hypothetical protein